ncbi:iron chelate uptake ABC transporter family permease subunit [Anaerococcus sp. NML200574]|uniref:ABC transporter permease n=1 Tax=unclassified Anaerococcus TaxID=2614126 RepID=UPI000D0B4E1A|nr:MULTISPECIES: iron chelate uptake ABC transporter family permease subunit [unclassified Anaerococcus]MCW6678235.1 iron chelate uptake ABC transporter family permease subunit [Anaerococcus sp. NML200574]MCW6701676.1 iron chelate uptake ABC transporter family permease subunit [Anaerococcus sp. NML200537]
MKSQKTSHKKLIDKNLIFLLLLVFGLAILSIFTGAYNIRENPEGWKMIFITRIPRTLSLMLTGLAMSMAGVVMQLISQNKLVEPTTTGTIEWAGLGLILAYILVPSASLFIRTSFSIIFAFIGSMVFFLLLRNIKFKSSLFVPIIGIMMGAVVSAISTFVALEFDMMQSLEVWFAGSFAPMQKGRYEYLYLIIIISVIIYIYADKLTLAGLGEAVSTNLGLNYKRIILVGNVLISLATGLVASVVGNVPFLGIIIPNLVSIYRGDNLRENLPYIALISMLVIIIADLISRTIIAPFEVPVSLILGSLGSISFLILLFRKKVGS